MEIEVAVEGEGEIGDLGGPACFTAPVKLEIAPKRVERSSGLILRRREFKKPSTPS